MEIDKVPESVDKLWSEMNRQRLADKLKRSNGSPKTTFDWSNDLKLEMPWKFAVYDVSMELPLDYSLHLREDSVREGVWKFEEEDLIQLSLNQPSYEDEPNKVCELLQGVMNGVKCRQQEMYSTHVLRFYRKSNTIPSMVTFELGPFVWIVFNHHGPWPAIHRRSDLDDSNYLTYNMKSSDVFVWDNGHGMVRADY